MITGIDLSEVVDYTLNGDSDNPTVWKLGLLPSYIAAKTFEDLKKNEMDVIFKIVQLGLRGWENYNVEFKTVEKTLFGRSIKVVPMELIESIPITAINEIAIKIMEINNLTDKERKN